jgi:hypothetical protein
VKLLSSGDEFGIVSVGQEAFGVFAFGQLARGFVAVGQVAIGVVAVGQLSVSVLGIGQGGIGIAWFAGMLGVGGRGICLRLIPGLDLPRIPPATVAFDDLARGALAQGFVRLEVVDGPRVPALAIAGRAVPVKLTPAVAGALQNAKRRPQGLGEVLAHVRRAGSGLVCDRLVEVPGGRRIHKGFAVLRFVLLIGAAVVWWFVFLPPS